MAMTTIFFLAMMICLGADILLTMFLGDRRLQQGAARTYAVWFQKLFARFHL